MKQTKQNKQDKTESRGLANVFYIIKLIWQADKGIVIYTLYKNISECIFYVFGFVYLTQYIFSCIENRSPISNLLKMA